MPNYRRAWHAGGTYFFTVNLLQRHNNDLLVRHMDLLRQVVAAVQSRRAFDLQGGLAICLSTTSCSPRRCGASDGGRSVRAHGNSSTRWRHKLRIARNGALPNIARQKSIDFAKARRGKHPISHSAWTPPAFGCACITPTL